jgi:tRNA dimethylallyltransferase
MKNKIIVVCGPTGIGKTGFAIKLAKLFSGEIVGADSMQLYKKMDVGTAKPDIDEQRMAVHHLIDLVEPDEDFDAGKYIKVADKTIADIASRGKLPIIAGGTGLYIRALLYGLFKSRASDPDIMEKLNRELNAFGNDFLHDKLKKIDPVLAAKIHPNDSFRVLNALEVYESTGTIKSEQLKEHEFKEEKYPSLKIGLYMDRKKLYERINQRVDIMMEQGFLNEVKELLDMGYNRELKPMQSIGYKHICDYFFDVTDYDETLRLLKRDTRRFAKRQFTWFRKEKDIIWLQPDEIEKASQLVADFLK